MSYGNTALYDLLNVSSQASVPEIKKAYRKLAREFHPDKNPSSGDKFKEISYAHEVLTDPQKRSVYDRYGMKGLQEGAREPSTSFFQDDIFSQIFDMGSGLGGCRFQNRYQRSEDTIYPLKVTLEDLYNGKCVKFHMNKTVVCVTCRGVGTKTGVKHWCRACHGRGVRVQYRPVLLLMQQQIYTTCEECSGQGTVVPERDRCVHCRGKKTYIEKKNFEVFIEKGMKDSQKIILRGEGNQSPDTQAGDIIVILQAEQHDRFQRLGNDLYVDKEISLTEALCGFSFGLTHLDGRILRVVQSPGSCIKTGQMRGLVGEGMPSRADPTQKGNLYIKFTVKFPQNYFANENQMKLLEALLGPKTEFTMPTGEDVEEVDLHDYTPTDDSSSRTYAEAFSEDDDEPFGAHFMPGGRVQCAQQ